MSERKKSFFKSNYDISLIYPSVNTYDYTAIYFYKYTVKYVGLPGEICHMVTTGVYITVYSAGIDFSRQNLTSTDVRSDVYRRQILSTKVDPRAVRLKCSFISQYNKHPQVSHCYRHSLFWTEVVSRAVYILNVKNPTFK